MVLDKNVWCSLIKSNIGAYTYLHIYEYKYMLSIMGYFTQKKNILKPWISIHRTDKNEV